MVSVVYGGIYQLCVNSCESDKMVLPRLSSDYRENDYQSEKSKMACMYVCLCNIHALIYCGTKVMAH